LKATLQYISTHLRVFDEGLHASRHQALPLQSIPLEPRAGRGHPLRLVAGERSLNSTPSGFRLAGVSAILAACDKMPQTAIRSSSGEPFRGPSKAKNRCRLPLSSCAACAPRPAAPPSPEREIAVMWSKTPSPRTSSPSCFGHQKGPAPTSYQGATQVASPVTTSTGPPDGEGP